MATAEHSHIDNATIEEVVTTVIIARVTDFFGFFVYAIASALVFPSVFFPFLDPLQGTLASFAVFSLAFVARPVASLIGRWLQHRIGRGTKVTIALMILGCATVAIGLLPGYERIGWLAPVLLAVLRLMQGLGLGGAWDGLTLQLQHVAPGHLQGRYAMVPQLGGPLGFVVAAAMFYVLTDFLTAEEFLKWGWRFAFFAVMAVNLVSLFARLRLLNADLGVESHVVTSAPLRDLIRHQWRPILLSTFVPLASYALFHLVTVFPVAYENLYTDFGMSNILLMQLMGGGLCIASVLISGVLADHIGRRRVILLSTVLIVGLSFAVGALATTPALFVLPGFAVLGLAYGQASAILPDRFEPHFRYSGTAMATNLSWLTGAAFAPLVAMGLVAWLGLWAVALYLLSGSAVTFAALYLHWRRESR